MMKRVELTGSQFEFLLEKILESKKVLLKSNSSIQLSLKDDQLELLLNQLSDLLSEIGLENDSELNETGLFIESMIDVLSRVLYRNE